MVRFRLTLHGRIYLGTVVRADPPLEQTRAMVQNDPLDRSNGYEAMASEFMARRSLSIGLETVREWAGGFAPHASILDLGCGHGRPISQLLVDRGFIVYGVDASPSLITALRTQLPSVQVQCASVEDSDFFGRTFDGAIAWGLMFLLSPDVQALLIRKVSRALNAGGRFVFTAPSQTCEWSDSLTGRVSCSLGREAYRRILLAEGLTLVGEGQDEGRNHYYLTTKEPTESV